MKTADITPRRRPAKKPRGFTLIELLVAMGCFSLIMFALMSYLSAAQRAWSLAAGNCSVYENAQLVFEIVGKDLQCAVASSRSGEEIPFLYTSTSEFALVSSLPDDDAPYDLCAVGYRFAGNKLYRGQRFDPAFFGVPATDTGWIPSATSELVSGVAALNVTCYDSNHAQLTTGTQSYNLPYAVGVTITLYDENLVTGDTSLVNQSKRTFSRLFFIGSGTAANCLR